MFKFLVYYAIPLCFIATFYIIMAHHLLLSTRNMVGEAQGQLKQIQSRKKVKISLPNLITVFSKVSSLKCHLYFKQSTGKISSNLIFFLFQCLLGGKNGAFFCGYLRSLFLPVARIFNLVLLLSRCGEALQSLLALGSRRGILSLIHKLLYQSNHIVLRQWNISKGKEHHGSLVPL